MTTDDGAVVGSPRRSVAELLAGYAQTLAELRRRGVVRSDNAPAGDYAEWLVATALGGTMAKTFSEKSWDVLLSTDEQVQKIQVKARVVSDPPLRGQLQTSPFRSWDFDQAAFVLFRHADYTVHQAALVPVATVKAAGTRREHINGWTVQMTPALLGSPGATDITERLRVNARMA